MAYKSKGNSPEFKGSPSPWGLALAALAAEELAHFGGCSPFLAFVDEFDEALLIAPTIQENRITAFAFFAPRMRAEDMKQFAYLGINGMASCLQNEWRDFGQAVVRFAIDPRRAQHLQVLWHDGKVREVTKLGKFLLKSVPALEDFDRTHGTRLAAERAAWLDETASILRRVSDTEPLLVAAPN